MADEQIKHLATRSEELSQETRVSVYLFNSSVECLIFDMDVMRLPSIAELYSTYGMTALIDATLKSQEDLATTSQLYGDHAFLTFVLTDGGENKSRRSPTQLARAVSTAPENWSLAFLVPNKEGERYVSQLGISDGNIAIWDTTSAAGLSQAAGQIRQATDSFMTNRASGIRGSRNVFSTGIDAVNTKTVSRTLTPLAKDAYKVYGVPFDQRIDEFVTAAAGEYNRGNAYYELVKSEEIQPSKKVVVVRKNDLQAFAGSEARHLIGLPDGDYARVRPDTNPEYDVFIQSTSVNRKLTKNTKVLVLK